ncbi:MAG: 2-oxoglutarate dehydrogenase E1 component [Phycisphaerales bacterium]|jgi:2-oxoglutarate dehydrogenase E1 component|nr:2-oxoglutarate dehydrogenase E1 component [Phycisphaerales bacterium]
MDPQHKCPSSSPPAGQPLKVPPPAVEGINGWNAAWIDDLHRRWSRRPEDVPASWQHFFKGFDLASVMRPASERSGQAAVRALIASYRQWGHLAADIDPLQRRPTTDAGLDLIESGGVDPDAQFDPDTLPLPCPSSLRDIQAWLKRSWCGTMGVESEHIRCKRRREWWRDRIESPEAQTPLDDDVRRRTLLDLQRATGLERFLMRRYVGSKWFSLEGGETLIPMLTELLESAAGNGVEEVAFGMAHRGRVNVLVNILEKSYDQLFTEFEEAWTEDFVESGGDVKYHRGYSTDIMTAGGSAMHLTMASNPSHLEWGHPVVLGRVRAKQRLRGDTTRSKCLPVLLHGDAAIAGQGVVQELANMAGLEPYDVGGSIHIIINNQVGFTAEHDEAFSGVYCTDVLRGQDIPILHVNGLDPDQCLRAIRLAVAWRHTFGDDIAIDLWGWRRYGHNETDEPAFTNPELYAAVRDQPATVEHYALKLESDGLIDPSEADQAEQRLLKIMDESQQRIRATPVRPTPPAFDDQSTWGGFSKSWSGAHIDTSVRRESLDRVCGAFAAVPDGFTAHPKLQRLLTERSTAVSDDRPLDWAMGELLAYGSLLLEGHPIRLTGEDCQRGTFSHRHAIFFDSVTGAAWSPLDHIDTGQSRMCVHNTPVTESGCIGFEYGYSLGDPNMLVLWEAQFGDFANVGQVYFDQFIASAERKWRRHSGLVCLLPHGYEGMGPEHSSARLERFLQLCADDNMEVAVPTTPAQMFHLLRRQMLRSFRKPLIVMTPKSLLRHRSATSKVSDLVSGHFQPVLDDHGVEAAGVNHVILCSGKVALDLNAARVDGPHAADTAVIRIEQLYPFPEPDIRSLFEKYAHVRHWTWVQEEPRNAGAWTWIADTFSERFGRRLDIVSRPANASPAVGSSRLHRDEQQAIIQSALDTGRGSPLPVEQHG